MMALLQCKTFFQHISVMLNVKKYNLFWLFSYVVRFLVKRRWRRIICWVLHGVRNSDEVEKNKIKSGAFQGYGHEKPWLPCLLLLEVLSEGWQSDRESESWSCFKKNIPFINHGYADMFWLRSVLRINRNRCAV